MIVDFPKTAARRAAKRLAASKPRRSKNGTPEERAAKKASPSIVELTPHRAMRTAAELRSESESVA